MKFSKLRKESKIRTFYLQKKDIFYTLRKIYAYCRFILAEELKLRTLSFGELSSGINSIPTKTLANILLKTTIEYFMC